jgi:phosphopantothenoylcysteine decarboxylase
MQLRKWADMLLVCPASADMIAKMVGGVCDNLAVSCA